MPGTDRARRRGLTRPQIVEPAGSGGAPRHAPADGDEAAQADPSDPLARAWLGLLCQMVPAAKRGLVSFATDADGAIVPAAGWPEDAPPAPGLVAVARMALARGSPVVAGEGDAGTNLDVACPLERDGARHGVLAVSVAVPLAQQQAVIQVLRWGGAWLDLLLASRRGDAGASPPLALEVVAAALAQERLRASATAVATRLAHGTGCERASVGFADGDRMRVAAISDTSMFDARTNLVRSIETAMEEARGLDGTATHPPPLDTPEQFVAAHRRLAKGERATGVCTVLLRHGGRVHGAITLERRTGPPFDPPTVERCEAIAGLVAPVLAMQRERDRPARARLADAFRALIGAGTLRARLLALAVALALAGLALAPAEFRISAPAALEGTVHRAVVAPFDGYVAAAHARAGETVKSGAPLAELDGSDLELEQRKWTGEREELRKEYRQALAGGDRAQARILGSRIEQAEARIALVEGQLARSRLVAPFDGVVISGDLSRSLGSPVERGELLFEVAPLEEYRVVLQVADRDVSEIRAGQTGVLTLSAVPGRPFEFEVSNVSSISHGEDGQPTFRVEAHIAEAEAYLRPGMGGIGKVVVGERRLLWIRRGR